MINILSKYANNKLQRVLCSVLSLAVTLTGMLTMSSCGVKIPVPDSSSADESRTAAYSSQYSSRTPSEQSNVSTALLRSLKGFSLKIYYPYSMNEQQRKILNNAAQKVSDEFDCTVSYDFDAKSDYGKKDIGVVRYATANSIVKMIDNEECTDISNAAKAAGVNLKSSFYNGDITACLNINNAQYGWFSAIGANEYPNFLVYNKTVLVSGGEKDISRTVSDGEWDLDRLERYMQKFSGGNRRAMFCSDASALFESLCVSKGQPLVSITSGASPSTQISGLTAKSAAETLDSWINEKKYCSYGSADDISSFINKKTAFFFVSGASAQTLFSQIEKMRVTDEFCAVPFPAAIASHIDKNVFSPRYFAYIPKSSSSHADKIIFLQNELYRELSVNSFELCSQSIGNHIGRLAKENIFGICASKSTNYAIPSVTAMFECYAAVGTNSYSICIAKGESVSSAEKKYLTAVKNYYSDTVKRYKITGSLKLP